MTTISSTVSVCRWIHWAAFSPGVCGKRMAASLVSGIALPDANGLAAIRFPQNPGENAAQGIHLQTLTVLLIVLIPRLLLALWARAWSATP